MIFREQARRASYLGSSDQLSLPSLVRRASEILNSEKLYKKVPIFENCHDQAFNQVLCFDIREQKTVRQDVQLSKVLIAKFDLKTQFFHEVYPCLDKNVYIKTRVKNTTEYQLLPGIASIFLNKNFLSKTKLKPCYPGEEFICHLGVDRSILLDIKSEKILSNQAGIISKNKSNIFTKVIL